MFYGYVKKKNSELNTLGVATQVVARPKDNHNLLTSKFTSKVIQEDNPLAVVGNKCYEIISDTEVVLKKELAANDTWGNYEELSNYPEPGTTYKQYYNEYEELDDSVVARVSSQDSFLFETLTFSDALDEARTLEDDENYIINKLADEIRYERINKLAGLKANMAKFGALFSDLHKLAIANSYDINKCVIDDLSGTILIDAENSSDYVIKVIDGETVLEVVGEGNSFVLQTLPIDVVAEKMFVIGNCISGSFEVEASNNGGTTWEDVPFNGTTKAQVSDEVVFQSPPSSGNTLILKLVLYKDNLQYMPLLSSWGFIWK